MLFDDIEYVVEQTMHACFLHRRLAIQNSQRLRSAYIGARKVGVEFAALVVLFVPFEHL